MRSHAKHVIVCVDDEKTILDALEEQITTQLGKHYECELCQSAEEGLDLLEELEEDGKSVAVVISDQMMPGMKGDEFLIKVNERYPETLKILLTGQASLESIRNSINKAAIYRYVNKPWEEEDLMLTVKEAGDSYLRYIRLQEFNHLLKQLNKATQEISGEVNIEQLFQKLMRNALSATGAEKGYVLMTQDDQQRVMGVGSILQEESKKLNQKMLEKNEELLQDITKVIQTLQQEKKKENFRIYTPIVKNNVQMGGILVENTLTRELFDENQIEILAMLSSQAAISLENAFMYDSLEEKTRELEYDKEQIESINRTIEEKNQTITDSIRYAKRIQASILPQPIILKQNFPDSLVLFKAKDIVSGDFYWWTEKGDWLYVAAVDCTGHGVPGAFMSVIGCNSLNQIVTHQEHPAPQWILKELHTLVRRMLKQDNVSNVSKDGMDLALCAIDKKNKVLHYAGANRPLYLIRNKELIEYQPSKYAIGGDTLDGNPPVFTGENIALEPNDEIFIFSDGYADQFGGPNHRKLTPKRLKDLLLSITEQPMDIQSELINHTYEKWRGDNEQTDDVLVIGIRFRPEDWEG